MFRQAAILLLLLSSWVLCNGQQGFRETQQSYPRVRDAYSEKWEALKQKLSAIDIDTAEMELYLVAYKEEEQVEVWVRSKGEQQFRILETYHVCQNSGVPGPKRRQGDLQVPEGFYHISAWNPWSSFHLSICINYPNRSDRVLGVQRNLGGNICIHGACVTIGCMPLTDEIIKKLYILFVQAKDGGQQQIPVSIYPARLNEDNYNRLTEKYSGDADRLNLWSDMKKAYLIFSEERRLPMITFLPDGRHHIR